MLRAWLLQTLAGNALHNHKVVCTCDGYVFVDPYGVHLPLGAKYVLIYVVIKILVEFCVFGNVYQRHTILSEISRYQQ